LWTHINVGSHTVDIAIEDVIGIERETRKSKWQSGEYYHMAWRDEERSDNNQEYQSLSPSLDPLAYQEFLQSELSFYNNNSNKNNNKNNNNNNNNNDNSNINKNYII